MRKFVWATELLLGVIAVDQLSKFILPTIYLNSNLAFGVDVIFLWIFFLIFIAAIGCIVFGRRFILADYIIPLSLMLGSGVSNLADRWTIGGVRDVFIIGSIYWNAADAFVIIGLVMILIRSYVSSTRRETSGEKIEA